jgi:hypothetical protein
MVCLLKETIMKRIAEKIETKELCSYGCGLPAQYKNGSGKLMCFTRSNLCPEIKRKNSSSLKKAYSSGIRISGKERYNLLPDDVKSRMNWSKGKFPKTKFEYGKCGNHKAVLIEERGYVCESCNLSEWMGKPLTLELEHIDGDNQNNVRENLKLLCPNCHSYTETWKGKNSVKKKLKQYVPDDQFIEALNSTKNVRQALLKLGLTPKGANYQRAYDLLKNATVVE